MGSIDYDMAVWELVEIIEMVRPMECEWPTGKFWAVLNMDEVVANAQHYRLDTVLRRQGTGAG